MPDIPEWTRADIIAVYQLSAQFPGPTSPREFITLLITSDTCLSDASKIGDSIPRHFTVVSIPTTHPDAPPRSNMVRGYYESVEMIREIPLAGGDAETNPVEWIMITRSDPGGGIPRFMVDRNVPSSIVQDAIKFLDWACAKDDDELETDADTRDPRRSMSMADTNGNSAGVGTSIADRPPHHQVMSYQSSQLDLQRTESVSSTSTSSAQSFASAEQFTTARDGIPVDTSIPTPSTSSQHSLATADESRHEKGLHKIEEKKDQLKAKLETAREKLDGELQVESAKTEKEIQKANEKHERERRKQEEKYRKELRKLEERREKETRKLLARQQKEADKKQLSRVQRERNEYKQRMELLEQENKLLKKQIGELQHENTVIVSRLGRSEEGVKFLKAIKEQEDNPRTRANSRSSDRSGKSVKSGRRSKNSSDSTSTGTLARAGTTHF